MLRLKKCRYQPFLEEVLKINRVVGIGSWFFTMVYRMSHGGGEGGRKMSLTTSGGFQKSKGKLKVIIAPIYINYEPSLRREILGTSYG